MKLLAAYIMRGRMQAIAVTAGAAIASLLVPVLVPIGIAALYLAGAASYVSGAAVGLVTLRVGFRQGLAVIAGAAAALALLGQLVLGNAWVVFAYLVAQWLPVWAIGERLRTSVDLASALRLAIGYGVLLVAGAYAVLGDPAVWWADLFKQALEAQTSAPALGEQVLANMAMLMTGVAVAGLTIGVVGALLLARWWQSLLYNPGGFREEFHGLRLGRNVSYAALALLVAAALPLGRFAHFGGELAIVVIAMFVLQGLAVVHGLVTARGAGRGWLSAVYLLLVIMPPPTAVTLAVAGLADNWFDFRGQFGRAEKG